MPKRHTLESGRRPSTLKQQSGKLDDLLPHAQSTPRRHSRIDDLMSSGSRSSQRRSTMKSQDLMLAPAVMSLNPRLTAAEKGGPPVMTTTRQRSKEGPDCFGKGAWMDRSESTSAIDELTESSNSPSKPSHATLTGFPELHRRQNELLDVAASESSEQGVSLQSPFASTQNEPVVDPNSVPTCDAHASVAIRIADEELGDLEPPGMSLQSPLASTQNEPVVDANSLPTCDAHASVATRTVDDEPGDLDPPGLRRLSSLLSETVTSRVSQRRMSCGRAGSPLRRQLSGCSFDEGRVPSDESSSRSPEAARSREGEARVTISRSLNDYVAHRSPCPVVRSRSMSPHPSSKILKQTIADGINADGSSNHGSSSSDVFSDVGSAVESEEEDIGPDSSRPKLSQPWPSPEHKKVHQEEQQKGRKSRLSMEDVNPELQRSRIVNILSALQKRQRGKRSRTEMQHLMQFLWSIHLFRQTGKCACEFACSLMNLVEFDGGVSIQREGTNIDKLYILLSGEAELSTERGGSSHSSPVKTFRPGDLLCDIGQANCLAFNIDQEYVSTASKVTITAVTAVQVISIPSTSFVEFVIERQRREADFRAAVKCVSEQEPVRRTAAEVHTIMKYLRFHGMFDTVPDDALENVARQLDIKSYTPSEVIGLEGGRPEQLIIVVRGAISSWRTVQFKHLQSSRRLQHFELNLTAGQIVAAHNAIANALRVQENSSSGTTAVDGDVKMTAQACVDVTRKDSVLRLAEWPLARGLHCSTAFVTHGEVVALCLARTAYLQYIRPYRVDEVQYEAALFIIRKVPAACRTGCDEKWLLETPLAKTHFLRAMPVNLRGCLLSNGRLLRLRRGEWLFHYQSPVSACYMLMRGTIGCYTESIFGARGESGRNSKTFARYGERHVGAGGARKSGIVGTVSAADESDHVPTSPASPTSPTSPRRKGGGNGQLLHHANQAIGVTRCCQLLNPGMIFGEWGIADEGQEEHWPYGACAEEDCELLELRGPTVHSAARDYMQQMSRCVTSSLPLQTIERVIHICRHTPVEKRPIDDLEVLSGFLNLYKDFSCLESHVRLELCQWAYFREVAEGDIVLKSGEVAAFFFIVLQGGVAAYILHGETELKVLEVPLWGAFGEIEQSGSYAFADGSSKSTCTVKAAMCTWLLCIDSERIARIVSQRHKGIAERDRAIVTLRHTAPANRTAADVDVLERLVCGNPFYAQLDKQVRQEVCRTMTWGGFDTLMPIVQQGDEADSCFVVLKGSVGVWINFDKSDDGNHRRGDRHHARKQSAHSVHEKEELPLSKKSIIVASSASKSEKEKGEAKNVEQALGLQKKKKARKTRRLKTSTSFVDKVTTVATQAFLTEPVSQSDSSPEATTKTHSEHTIEIDPQTGGPKGGQLVRVLGEGTCFGEAGLLRLEKRNATIVAREACDCGVIQKQVFNSILRGAYLKDLQHKAEFLERHLPKKHCTYRRGAPPPREASKEDFEQLAGFFSKHNECRGTVLCTAGRPCSRLFIIKEGTCKVIHAVTSTCLTSHEIGELGVGQVLGGVSHILGQGSEPYSVVCASAEVELLRMEPNDVKTRIPTPLLEALCVVEKDRQSRLEQRVAALESRIHVKSNSVIPPRLSRERWLAGPFMRHKHFALMVDLGKCSLMRKLYADWEPPGPDEDPSSNRSILHYHLDDYITEDEFLRHQEGIDDTSKLNHMLALPWFRDGSDEKATAHPCRPNSGTGRGHRQLLIKRHLAEQASDPPGGARWPGRIVAREASQEVTSNRSAPRKGAPRPKSAPGMHFSPWGVPLGIAKQASLPAAQVGTTKRHYVDVVLRILPSKGVQPPELIDDILNDDIPYSFMGSTCEPDMSALDFAGDTGRERDPSNVPSPSPSRKGSRHHAAGRPSSPMRIRHYPSSRNQMLLLPSPTGAALEDDVHIAAPSHACSPSHTHATFQERKEADEPDERQTAHAAKDDVGPQLRPQTSMEGQASPQSADSNGSDVAPNDVREEWSVDLMELASGPSPALSVVEPGAPNKSIAPSEPAASSNHEVALLEPVTSLEASPRSRSPSPTQQALVLHSQPTLVAELPSRRLPGALNAGRTLPCGIPRPANGGGRPRRRDGGEVEATPSHRRRLQPVVEATLDASPQSKRTICAVKCYARGEAFRQIERNADRGRTISSRAASADARSAQAVAARAEVEIARRRAGR